MKEKFAALLMMLTLFMTMDLTAQIELKSNGFNDVLLGKNITEINDVVNFSFYPDKKLFDVFPSDSNFFLWQPGKSISIGNSKIRYLFLYTDSAQTIVKISVLLEDTQGELESYLTNIYGQPKTKAETGYEGMRNRDLTLWDTSLGAVLFLAKSFREDPALNFEITKLEFYYPGKANELGKYIVSPRSIR